ncbi:hypothetical protein [Micromonospora sp. NPDC049107]|uniref:hypothetical protein n=1 Tax=Micromonospora sp. NPDC049107 TaxID=3154349 RepID=UPI003405E7C5
MDKIILPWDLAAGQPRAFDVLAAKVVGQNVSAVGYQPVSGGEWPNGHRHDTVHEIDMALKFSLEGGGSLVVRWEMQGLNEGLGVGLLTDSLAGEFGSVDFLDVSATPEWRPLLGETIANIVGAFHVPNEGCPEALWSMRFDFSHGRSAVVALGEMSGDDLGYLPDGLVAIFDETEARAFTVGSSAQSAWGEF